MAKKALQRHSAKTRGPRRRRAGIPRLSDKHDAFPIVGIGASAGGLEALDQFFRHLPAQPGMAFVVVQHLDPTYKTMIVELLQSATPLKVIRVRDRLKVESDHVYVISPNQDMSILHGILHLLDPVDPRGLRRPIDFFLRALADDQRERSMGVILSGMGSDGMLGARAIKEHAGVVFVQTPASAKFDAMPSNTINAGLADVVAPVEELPGKIAAYFGRTPIIVAVAPVRPLASSTGFLGSAETISATSDLLAPIDGNARLFPRLEGRLRIGPTEFTTPTFLARPRASEAAGQGALKSAADLQILAEQVLLHRYAPAAVLTDGKGDILFISGRTGKYLEPAPGKANWNIYAMAREGLRHVLGVAFQRALREKRQVVVSPARLSADWAGQAVTIAIEPIQAPEALLGTVIVVFTDLVAPAIAPKGTVGIAQPIAALVADPKSPLGRLEWRNTG